MSTNSLQQKKAVQYNPRIISYTLIVLFWSLTLFYFVALQQNIDIKNLAARCLNNFYIPHYNFCLSWSIGKFNVNFYFYFIILFSILTSILFRNLFWRSRTDVKLTAEMQYIIIIVFIGLVVLQAISQAQYFIVKFNTYHGRNIEARLFGSLKETYDFAQYCQRRLPGQHSAELITDLDTSKDPGMFIHRALAYYLYPIDIRDIRKYPKNYLIGFKKRAAAVHIPQGYKMIGSTGKDNILAIKLDDQP